MRNIYNFNTERQQNNKPIDLAEMVAIRMATLIWGRGFYLSTENEQIKAKWKIIQENNHLDSFFYEMEKMNSALGYTLVALDMDDAEEDKDRIPYFNIAQPYGNYLIEEVHGEIIKLVCWLRYGNSNSKPFMVRVEYTPTKILKTIYMADGKTEMAKDEADKLYKKNNIDREYLHNVGVVPAVLFQNIPKKNFIGGSQGTQWYPDGTAVAELQNLLNFIFDVLKKEAKFNRTRVFADLNQQNIKEILQSIAGVIDQKQPLSMKLEDVIGDFILPSNLAPVEGSGGNPIAILQGDPKFAQYKEAIDHIIDLYFRGCNLSVAKDTSGEVTATEVQYQNSTEASTIIFKRKFRQQQIKKFLDKVFMIMGLEQGTFEGDYAFEIKDNTSLNTFEDTEREIEMINMGLSSRIRAYMKLNQVSKEEAEEAIKEIDTENNEYGIPLEGEEQDGDADDKDGDKFK